MAAMSLSRPTADAPAATSTVRAAIESFGATRSLYKGIGTFGSASVAERMGVVTSPLDVASTVRAAIDSINPTKDLREAMRRPVGPDAARYGGVLGALSPTVGEQMRASTHPWDVSSTVRAAINSFDATRPAREELRRQFGPETSRLYKGIGTFGSASVAERMGVVTSPLDVASTVRAAIDSINPTKDLREAMRRPVGPDAARYGGVLGALSPTVGEQMRASTHPWDVSSTVRAAINSFDATRPAREELRRQFGPETSRLYKGIGTFGSASVAERMGVVTSPLDVASTVRAAIDSINPTKDLREAMRRPVGPDAARYGGVLGALSPTVGEQMRASTHPWDVSSTVRAAINSFDATRELRDVMRVASEPAPWGVADTVTARGFIVVGYEVAETFLRWLVRCAPSRAEAKAACEAMAALDAMAALAKYLLSGQIESSELVLGFVLAWTCFLLGLAER